MVGNQLTVGPTSSILAAATLPLQPGGLVRAPRQSALASGPRSKTVKCGKVALKKCQVCFATTAWMALSSGMANHSGFLGPGTELFSWLLGREVYPVLNKPITSGATHVCSQMKLFWAARLVMPHPPQPTSIGIWVLARYRSRGPERLPSASKIVT